MLPTAKKGRKTYYLDERLLQARNVKNPHDYIDFGSVVEMGLYFFQPQPETKKGE